MHELSIAISLVDAVCEELPRFGEFVSVRSVRIRVGPLSGVVPEALAFAFDVAAADSAIAGAQLQIERTHGAELELAAVEIIDADTDSRGAQEHPEEERPCGRGAPRTL
jgi:hydrogenase nickel incorporation protein HypA/HybF